MIKTDRLLLRPLAESDCPAIVAELNNFAICKNLARVPFPYHLSDAAEFLTFARSLDQRSLVCAITLNPNPDTLIGIVSYEYSPEKSDAELGYWLSENYWRKGIMSEAVNAIVDHAFTISKLETLVSCYHNDNPNSGRILKRIGFRLRDQSTNFSKAQGTIVPVTNMRFTREMWHNQQKSRRD